MESKSILACSGADILLRMKELSPGRPLKLLVVWLDPKWLQSSEIGGQQLAFLQAHSDPIDSSSNKKNVKCETWNEVQGDQANSRSFGFPHFFCPVAEWQSLRKPIKTIKRSTFTQVKTVKPLLGLLFPAFPCFLAACCLQPTRINTVFFESNPQH